MTPTPNDSDFPNSRKAGIKLASPPEGEEVVISGISGYFPECNNLHEFRDKLFDKIDLVTDDDRRWKPGHPEIPQRTGKINNVTKFDAAFFGIHYKQTHAMDPMCRLLLERAYEAVVDAGINPAELRGSKTGVFIGACFSETEKTWLYEKLQVCGYGITGCSRVMFANRISYWLGLNGPSYTVDSACSSSLYAFEHAYKAIRDGYCDNAFVGGSNLCLHPHVSLQFARLGVLSENGMCRPFDNAANGYCRSEAIAMVFLQKQKAAKRIYATVIHAKTNCDGFKEEGITYPSGPMQQKLLEDFYGECRIDPSTIGFVEAHGTGTRAGDPEELNALVNVFCKNRTKPLPIGSIKSSIGHSEPASGLCSIAKVIIAFEENIIPPNIHYDTPREGVEGLINGKLRVVTEKEAPENGWAALNSFGFGGANCHVLLRRNEVEKKKVKISSDSIPYIVVASGRTEEAVDTILSNVESQPQIDPEFIKLLHDIHSIKIHGHRYRGYTIMSPVQSSPLAREIQYYDASDRPIWYLFSGVGTQSSGSGKLLMTIPSFRTTILNLSQLLKPKGIDLTSIILSEDTKTLKNVVNSVTGIIATQIALVNVLTSVDIKADGFIGHGIGEITCAYADGLLSAEEAIMCAYFCGLALNESTQQSDVFFAEVDSSYKAVKSLSPPEINLIYHHGPKRCVVCGPKRSINTFIKILQKHQITSKEIEHLNVIPNMRYTSGTDTKLAKFLNQIIPKPKKRSTRWISSSVPGEGSQTSLAEYCSSSYFINNLVNPVLLEEALSKVPENAIIIEIAPNDILQQTLQDILPEDSVQLAATTKATSILETLGRLFELGAQPQLANLYPEVKYPVSRSTPMIAPLVKWDHSDDWFVVSVKLQEKLESGERILTINVAEEDVQYIRGHVIDGRNLYPATGYVHMVWETMAIMHGKEHSELSVAFENVRFLRATNMPKDGSMEFQIVIQKGSGSFEIVESDVSIVTGKCYVLENPEEEMIDLEPLEPARGEDLIDFAMKDLYKELHIRGYNYSGLFKSLLSADNLGHTGRIVWSGNWVAFMDNMLQIEILQADSRSLFVPTSIEKIIIDVKKHADAIKSMDEVQSIPVYAHRNINVVQAGGIEMRGLKVNGITRRKLMGEPVLESHKFFHHFGSSDLSIERIIRACVHIALENQEGIKVKVIELVDKEYFPNCQVFSPMIASILGDLPLIQAFIKIFSPCDIRSSKTDLSSDIQIEDRKISSEQNCNIIIGSNLLQNKVNLKNALASLIKNGYIISHETLEEKVTDFEDLDILIALDLDLEDGKVVLLKKKEEKPSTTTPITLRITQDSFNWVSELKTILKDNANKEIILFCEDTTSGIMGLSNCIRKETGGDNVRCVFIMDKNTPPFDLTNPFYSSQLDRGLCFNVFKDGKWGTYRHLLLEESKPISVYHAYNNVVTRGDLSSLSWLQGHLKPTGNKLDEFEQIAEIYYCALNFRDVMTATGRITPDVVETRRLMQDCVQGIEFSGRSKEGKRIMGMVGSHALSNMVIVDKRLTWEIPDGMSMEDATTIPVAYGTSYYALTMSGNMKAGESILIHAGSGGVGQAAISVCLHHGLTVFTTVGTEEKRNFIKKRFPQLTDRNIGNSRDTSFEQLIMRETNGRGVDLVLNSLAEEKLQASVRCLALGGRFLEIGKFDLSRNNSLGLKLFAEGITFAGVSMEKLFFATGPVKDELNRLVQEGINSGAVIPLTKVLFEADECEQAFRYMAAGKHIGKVLIKIRPEEEVKHIIPKPITMLAYPRTYCDPDKTIVILGGLGGFGLELADWLVTRNARKLVLVSRSGMRTGYQSYRIRTWRSYGAVVKISTADIRTENGVKDLLEEANKLGPVSHIFNLAVELHDALFENQTEELFTASLAPKAFATTHLDKLSRTLCPELEHFVVFSSVSCGRGNVGQTNYGMANSVMERICEERKKCGLPGLAIQFGAVGDVGLVADMQEENKEVVIGGTLQQKISSCLQVLDQFMNQPEPIVASMVVAAKRAGVGSSGSLAECVANILGVNDIKTISMHSSLAELGMDSMMAVEIKQMLEREFDVILTPQDIRSMTFARLGEISAADTSNKDAAPAVAAAGAPTTIIEDSEIEAVDISFEKVKTSLLFRAFGDEKAASTPLIHLPSKAICENIEATSLNSKQPVLFMFPGIEGMASIMAPLAKGLNYPVLCVNYTTENKCESVEQLSGEIIEVLEKRLPKGRPFSILGYSFGGLVALEITRLLEEKGLTGRLILVDSSPEYFRHLLRTAILDDNEDIMQVNMLLAIVNGFAPQSATTMLKLVGEFTKLGSWDERVDYLISLDYENLVEQNKTHLNFIANSAYNRIKSVQKFEFNHTLQTPTLLIRPQSITENFENDYGLSKMFKNLEVKTVDSNHADIVGEVETAQFVNDHII